MVDIQQQLNDLLDTLRQAYDSSTEWLESLDGHIFYFVTKPTHDAKDMKLLDYLLQESNKVKDLRQNISNVIDEVEDQINSI